MQFYRVWMGAVLIYTTTSEFHLLKYKDIKILSNAVGTESVSGRQLRVQDLLLGYDLLKTIKRQLKDNQATIKSQGKIKGQSRDSTPP